MTGNPEDEFLQGRTLEREAIYRFCKDFLVLEENGKPWIECFDNQTHHLFLMLGRDISPNVRVILDKIVEKIGEVKQHRGKKGDDATAFERLELTNLVVSIAPYYEN